MLYTVFFPFRCVLSREKSPLFGRCKKGNRNALLRFYMEYIQSVYIPTLSGNPFLINQPGFYWLNRSNVFRQSELRSMGPAPEVWDLGLNFWKGIFSRRFMNWMISGNLHATISGKSHRKFLDTLHSQFPKKIGLPEVVSQNFESSFFHGKTDTEFQCQAQRFQLVPKLMPKFHSSWCHQRDEWSMLNDWCWQWWLWNVKKQDKQNNIVEKPWQPVCFQSFKWLMSAM